MLIVTLAWSGLCGWLAGWLVGYVASAMICTAAVLLVFISFGVLARSYLACVHASVCVCLLMCWCLVFCVLLMRIRFSDGRAIAKRKPKENACCSF